MKRRRGAVLWLLLTLSPGFALAVGGRGDLLPVRTAESAPAAPAAFDPDPASPTYSANLTHRYYPLAPGDQYALSGYGSLSGDLNLVTGWESPVTVDGVDCLYVIEEYFTGAAYARFDYAMAQDVDGNVWVLMDVGWDGGQYDEFVYGSAAPAYFLWNELEVGDSRQIVSLSADLEEQRTGIGPYTECLQVSNGSTDNSYYAPGVGLVKIAFDDGDGLVRVLLGEPQPGFGTLQFGSEVYDAVEEAGTFPATVVRSGGSHDVVWVEFEVTGVTSNFVKEGEEMSLFSRDPKTVYLAPGQGKVVFDVVILDNEVWNNRGTGTLELTSPGGGAGLGERTIATVTIDEAETGEDPGTFIGPCFLDTLGLW